MYQIIPGKLSYTCTEEPPAPSAQLKYYTTEHSLVYKAYNQDFGPLNLSQTYQFIEQLRHQLESLLPAQVLVFYTSGKPAAHANALALLGLFLLIQNSMAASEIVAILEAVRPIPMPFRDISQGVCPLALYVRDVIEGAERAIHGGLHSPAQFNAQKFDQMFQPEFGNISEIAQARVFACPSPVDPGHVFYKQQPLAPMQFIKAFKLLGITALIRLNDAYYQRQEFINNFIHHFDLQFPDGSIPPDEIVTKFLKIMDQEKTVAIHCMAGLGRTGTLICIYLMARHQFTAKESLGWIRLTRPGSVSGHQQLYVVQMEEKIRGNKLTAQPSFTNHRRRQPGYQMLDLDSGDSRAARATQPATSSTHTINQVVNNEDEEDGMRTQRANVHRNKPKQKIELMPLPSLGASKRRRGGQF